MRRDLILWLFALALALTACAKNVSESGGEILPGQCRQDGQNWQFKPCGAQKSLRLEGSRAIMNELAARRERLGSGSVLYAELGGDATADGFVVRRICLTGRLLSEDCGQQQLFGELVALDRGVIANRRERICYDAKGPNVELTRLHFDKAASEVLARRLKQEPPAAAEFQPEEGASCQSDEQVCYVRGRPNAVLSRALYGEPQAGAAAELKGVSWKWRATVMHDESRIAPAEPGNYTLRFGDGGALSLRVDCNRAAGSYHIKGRAMNLDVKLLTKVMCAPNSLEREYLKGVNSVESFSLEGGVLYLRLRLDAGVMEFVQ
ncbi:MAG: META domain protein [Deltaproteobacteria bacterium ADurb.Bin510]|nr:MAG: META domain protein [Deltaproteobacteria bacterium ADurb.Bin510]